MFLHLILSYRAPASFPQLKNLTAGAPPHETEMDAVGYLYPFPGKKKESCVEGELLLVALIFGPADIAFVMIFDHHLLCPDRLAMPVAPPCPSFDEGGAFLAFPIHVNSCIKGILENRDDVAVADRHPVEAGHATLRRRAAGSGSDRLSSRATPGTRCRARGNG
jgi:hypothetical protein